MTLEQMATIIATGDVPLALRMSQSDADLRSVRRALGIRKKGTFSGMTKDEVLDKLQQNISAANQD
jgi:hypothetical protein